MFFPKRLLPLLCLGSALVAQSNDLNTLLGAAYEYSTAGMSASRSMLKLDLTKARGDAGAPSPLPILLFKSLDVSHWTFFYNLKNPYGPGCLLGQNPDPGPNPDTGPGPGPNPDPGPAPAPQPAPQPFLSASAQCSQGIFGDFRLSPTSISDSKTIAGAWVATSIDAAIGTLNNQGYVQGFTSVTLMRSTNPQLPDAYVYAFNCPLESTVVGISASSGQLLWKEFY